MWNRRSCTGNECSSKKELQLARSTLQIKEQLEKAKDQAKKEHNAKKEAIEQLKAEARRADDLKSAMDEERSHIGRIEDKVARLEANKVKLEEQASYIVCGVCSTSDNKSKFIVDGGLLCLGCDIRAVCPGCKKDSDCRELCKIVLPRVFDNPSSSICAFCRQTESIRSIPHRGGRVFAFPAGHVVGETG
ncbi:unnamed protein product [Amoebophrya sp. A25]|nr:unnamed protein product [Amoebophrya sp. A25]|eukprot:GSA25T00026583001.1